MSFHGSGDGAGDWTSGGPLLAEWQSVGPGSSLAGSGRAGAKLGVAQGMSGENHDWIGTHGGSQKIIRVFSHTSHEKLAFLCLSLDLCQSTRPQDAHPKTNTSAKRSIAQPTEHPVGSLGLLSCYMIMLQSCYVHVCYNRVYMIKLYNML